MLRMIDLLSDFPVDVTFDFEKILEQNELENEQHDEGQKPGEMCRFYLKGICMKGNSCPFCHSKSDRSVVCKYWLRGLCKKNDLCEFLHEYDMSKMPECYFFSKFGECTNPECVYIHVDPETRSRECPWYARGFCIHGPRCRHKHIKKLACENYLLGFCPLGPSCKLGHPKYELPKDNEANTPSTIPKAPIFCNKCGVLGHKAQTCTATVQQTPIPMLTNTQPNTNNYVNKPHRPLESVTCFKCGQRGHYADTCANPRVPPPLGGYVIPNSQNNFNSINNVIQDTSTFQPHFKYPKMVNNNFQSKIPVWDGDT